MYLSHENKHTSLDVPKYSNLTGPHPKQHGSRRTPPLDVIGSTRFFGWQDLGHVKCWRFEKRSYLRMTIRMWLGGWDLKCGQRLLVNQRGWKDGFWSALFFHNNPEHLTSCPKLSQNIKVLDKLQRLSAMRRDLGEFFGLGRNAWTETFHSHLVSWHRVPPYNVAKILST